MKTDPKVRIAIVGSADGQLEKMLAGSGARITSRASDELGALAHSTAPQVEAVVLDLRGQTTLPPALTTMRRHHPAVGVVIVASALDPPLMLDAMRAGVNEWVAEPVTTASLSAAIQRVIMQRVSKAPDGQVFAFVGAKGGVGTTTVAVNVATALAKTAPRKSLLVDLHLSDGDAALFLGAEPRFTTVDAIENIHRLDEAYLRGVVTTSKAGVQLLASAERTVSATVSADGVREVIEFAAQHYRYVVLDVPRSDMTMLDALDPASSIVIVANQELATVRRAGALALTLRQRYGKERVGVVINRFDRAAEIGREDVERVTGGGVRHVIPSDYRLALEGLNKGEPIVVADHNGLAGSFSRLAGLLAGLHTDGRGREERQAGFLGRLRIARS